MSTETTADGAAERPLASRDETLLELLTPERLRPYLQATDGDLDAAMRLYEWNADASGALLVLSGMVEVVARNAMDKALLAWADGRGAADWLDVVPLDERGCTDIKKARERATSYGRKPEVRGKVVAELTLGFWRYLTAKRYHTYLWLPALNDAFPGGPDNARVRRREVEHRMAMLHHIRNRACHHEPIHRRDLMKDYREAVELASWVHPDGGAWVAARSAIPVLISSHPATGSCVGTHLL